jgi:hypothetical protein
MRSLIALAVATVVSSALPALAQPAADAQEAWRLGGPRSVTPTGPGRVKEVSGVLVSDPAGREIRLDAAGRDVFRVPYDRIVAMHYERAGYPGRFLRRPSFYVVVHYTDAAGSPAAETIRILSERDALAAIDTFQQHTGRGVERSVTGEAFLGIPIRARVGTRVAVTDSAGEAVKGTIAELSSSSVTLSQSDGGDRVFDAKAVRRIRLLYSPRHDALVGFSGGAAFTVFSVWLSAGLSGCYTSPTSSCHIARAMIGGAVIGGGIGAIIGTTIGSIRYPFNHAFDVFRAGPASAPRSSVVTIAPQFGSSRRAVVVSLIF